MVGAEDIYKKMMGPPLAVALFFKIPETYEVRQTSLEPYLSLEGPFVKVSGLRSPAKNWIN